MSWWKEETMVCLRLIWQLGVQYRHVTVPEPPPNLDLRTRNQIPNEAAHCKPFLQEWILQRIKERKKPISFAFNVARKRRLRQWETQSTHPNRKHIEIDVPFDSILNLVDTNWDRYDNWAPACIQIHPLGIPHRKRTHTPMCSFKLEIIFCCCLKHEWNILAGAMIFIPFRNMFERTTYR